MEGPSIYLAVEQLQPFIGKTIQSLEGNTKIGKERLANKQILDIFSHGKVLMFQFDSFALRVHFLLYGSFEALVNHEKVTGDYRRKERPTRLSLVLENGRIDMYSCSLRFIEEEHAKQLFDFSIDTMSPSWDAEKAYAKLKGLTELEIADVLLDQTIFAGIGNIIKNEVLILAGISPLAKIKTLSNDKIKEIITLSRDYVFKFYQWRKNFELKQHYKVYRQRTCKICGNKLTRQKTGTRQRISFICPLCQKS